MTIERARIIKGAFDVSEAPGSPTSAPTRVAPAPSSVASASSVGVDPMTTTPRARRIAGEILEARAEAARIVAEAQDRAAAVIAGAAAEARAEAQEKEVARFAAAFLALRDAESKQTERGLDRIVELAVILAERVIGEAIRVEPSRIAELAASAIQEARGARRVRIDASPNDVPALRETLGAIGQVADIQADESLERGSLIVHTDLGRIDARLAPQLTRLAAALREALASS